MQVAAILKLWLHSLPQAVIPSEVYEDAMATQRPDFTQQQQVSALHVLLRKCEHQVLQLLYPLMEVCVMGFILVPAPAACPLGISHVSMLTTHINQWLEHVHLPHACCCIQRKKEQIALQCVSIAVFTLIVSLLNIWQLVITRDCRLQFVIVCK